MLTQPRKPETNFNPEFVSSRHRASCAVGGGGEAHHSAADVTAGGAALDLLLERSRTRVRAGQLAFLDAVDMAYSAADLGGLVERYGDDLVQATR